MGQKKVWELWCWAQAGPYLSGSFLMPTQQMGHLLRVSLWSSCCVRSVKLGSLSQGLKKVAWAGPNLSAVVMTSGGQPAESSGLRCVQQIGVLLRRVYVRHNFPVHKSPKFKYLLFPTLDSGLLNMSGFV